MNILIHFSTLVLFFVFFSQTGSSQNAEYKTIRYSYSFENVSSENQIDLLKKDVEALKDIQSVKTIYKRDSGKGLLIVEVKEKIKRRENEEAFDITQLKKLIISNQLTPIELTQEEIIIKY
jgi:hypothetical protein